MKAAHLTSVHTRFDTRIFMKQCRTLAANKYSVVLIVADGRGKACTEGLNILDVGKPTARLSRFFVTTTRIFRKAVSERADLYHLHDPELLPAGILLRMLGKKVVFDMHENLPRQVLSKYYLGKFSRVVFSRILYYFQRFAFRFMPVIFAELSYANDFKDIRKCVTVLNYPLIEREPANLKSISEKFHLGYIGEISHERGINTLIQTINHIDRKDITLMLAGPVRPDVAENPGFQQALSDGWLTSLGPLAPEEAWSQMSLCHAGLALLHPSPNFVESYPTKLFEYMMLGLPVIASDFPLWKEIIEGNRCGICVNPMDPRAIAEAIDYLAAHPEEAGEMGKRGRQAVEEKYNWTTEEKKLLQLYADLLQT